MVTEEELKAIRVPTLAVVGAGDFVKRNVDDLKGLPGLKTVVIEKCDHVTAFRIQYWDDKKKDWAREWSTRSVDHTNDLPTRVRFTLEFQLDRNRTEKLTTEAQIALTRPLDF